MGYSELSHVSVGAGPQSSGLLDALKLERLQASQQALLSYLTAPSLGPQPSILLISIPRTPALGPQPSILLIFTRIQKPGEPEYRALCSQFWGLRPSLLAVRAHRRSRQQFKKARAA